MIYIVATLLSLFFSRIFVVTKDTPLIKKIFVVLIAAMPFVLLSSFRMGIGTDYYNYQSIFEFIHDYDFELLRYDIEPGYALLNIAVDRAFHDFRWMIGIVSFLYIIFMFVFLYHESVDKSFSIFLFVALTFYFSSLNAIREHLGISLLMLSIPLVRKRKFIFFLILVFIAGMFHYSCFAFVIVYFIYPLKITPKTAFILAAVFIALSIPISSVLVRIISNTRYARYLGGEAGYSLASLLGISIQFIIFVFSSIFFKKDEKYQFYYFLQLLSLCVCILGGIIPLMTRIKWLFFVPSIVLIPMVFQNIKKSDDRAILKLLVSLACIAYAFVVVYIKHSYEVYPYKSVFEVDSVIWF